MSKSLAVAVASGIVASVVGCGGAPTPAPEVPGAPVEGAAGAGGPGSKAAPAEKHACGGTQGCNANMHKKAPEPQPAPGAPKSP